MSWGTNSLDFRFKTKDFGDEQMFLKFINRDERMKLGILLEDDNGTNGLIENYENVKQTFQ